MKLSIKHLAPYLPYGLRCKDGNTNFEMTGSFLDQCFNYGEIGDVKPILRPMTDLDDPKKYIGDSYSYLSEMNLGLPRYTDKDLDFEIEHNHRSDSTYVSCDDAYKVYEFLFANHFDVFGLIEQNLAVDINTIEQ